MADVIGHVLEITKAFRKHNAPSALANTADGTPGRDEQALRCDRRQGTSRSAPA